MTPPAFRQLRYRLLGATALVCAGAAAGQVATPPSGSYQATGTPVDANSAMVVRGSGTTTITVNAPTAVINWVPDSSINTANANAPLLIQSNGTTATFTGANDYVVLNRFLPTDTTRPILFNGATESLVGGQRGGTLWFYSPGGLILGSGANFNVGSLLLSGSDIAYDPSGVIINPAQATFLGSQSADFQSNAIIRLEPGATAPQINASNYVAMFAPRIEQTGSVRAGGSVAYVAAERGTLTFPSAGGLFTISVDEGADNGSLIHNGITTGPLSNTARGVYFVAVPKNNAISMLLGGAIGYDQAIGATTIGDTVVLSGNSSVTGLTPGNLANNIFQTPLNIFGQQLTINANLASSSTGLTFDANPSLISVLGDTNIQAGTTLFSNQPGGAFNFGGALAINGFYGTPGQTRTAGTVTWNIAAGTVSVGSGVSIDASGQGVTTTFTGDQGLGGVVELTVNRSNLSVGTRGTGFGQSFTVNADGRGGTGRFGGLGQGGRIDLDLSDSTVSVPGDFSVSANGFGGPAAISSPVPQPSPGQAFARAGDGQGGTVNLVTNTGDSGTFVVPGTISLSANGAGGTAGPSFGGKPGGEDGGNGYGGTVMALLGAGLTSTANFVMSALGTGGAGGNSSGGDFRFSQNAVVPRDAGRGGNGRAGDVTLSIDDQLRADTVQLLSSGTGGAGGTATRDTVYAFTDPNGNSGNGGFGGSGSGERATLTVGGASELTRRTLTRASGGILEQATGTGGAGGGSVNGTAGFGGAGSGGEAIVETLGGTIDTGQLTQSTFARGGGGGTGSNPGSGGTGGTATGGAVRVSASGGGTSAGITVTQATIDSSAVYGRGGVQSFTPDLRPIYVSDPFSTSSGGAVTIEADDAGLRLGAVNITSYATQLRPNASPADDPSISNYIAPLNTNGIGVFGGAVTIGAARAAIVTTGDLNIDARGVAPDAVAGPRDGQGGMIQIFATGDAALTVNGVANVTTRGFGGSTPTLLTTAGNGIGGSITVTAGDVDFPGGTVDLGYAFLNSRADGGSVPVTPPPPPPPPNQPPPPPPRRP